MLQHIFFDSIKVTHLGGSVTGWYKEKYLTVTADDAATELQQALQTVKQLFLTACNLRQDRKKNVTISAINFGRNARHVFCTITGRHVVNKTAHRLTTGRIALMRTGVKKPIGSAHMRLVNKLCQATHKWVVQQLFDQNCDDYHAITAEDVARAERKFIEYWEKRGR